MTCICTMACNLNTTAFSKPLINLRHGDHQSDPRILGHGATLGGSFQGDFSSREAYRLHHNSRNILRYECSKATPPRCFEIEPNALELDLLDATSSSFHPFRHARASPDHEVRTTAHCRFGHNITPAYLFQTMRIYRCPLQTLFSRPSRWVRRLTASSLSPMARTKPQRA